MSIIYSLNVLLLIFFVSFSAIAQTPTKKTELLKIAINKNLEFVEQKAIALEYAKQNNIPVFIKSEEGFSELMRIDEFGRPQYYSTDNSNSAKTVSTNKVHTNGGAGLSLNGSGMTVHEWDAGAVRATHQEFDGRVTQVDNASYPHSHSSHVAGTMVAGGVVTIAKGMAPEANLRAFDWNNDMSEMASEAANNGALVSNHSYGYTRGWVWTGSTWYWQGNESVSTEEDYLFGFYDSQAEDWDQIAFNAPYYLIVKSAGNDRDDDGPDDNPPYPSDGQYDCVAHAAVAKNVLTVGAVKDIANGYSEPADVRLADFSSWGPTDDGRIKPDIVTNGFGLYSTREDHDSDYGASSGTSMAAPSATGSLILLQEHYEDLNGSGQFMKAATLKGLAIHTADEAGDTDGPDYEHGHGLLNTLKAAQLISENDTYANIAEHTLQNGESFNRSVKAKGSEPLVVTISWTDKAGTPVAAELDPEDPMLINDLDLHVENDSENYFPWKLDKSNPSNGATRTGKNYVDNVEVLRIDEPIENNTYMIIVDHDGALTDGYQDFSLIISGIKANDSLPPQADFSSSGTIAYTGNAVSYFDESTDVPLSWSWTFEGASPASSASKNPVVTYSESGTYAVTLTASNSIGTDVKTITDYITIVDQQNTYCPVTGTDYEDFWISQVELNGYVNNTQGNGYSDFTTDFIEILPGSNSIGLTPGFNDAQRKMAWTVWIDWNKDGDFDDEGETVFTPLASKVKVSGSFDIPDGYQGYTIMRIGSRRSVTGELNPCVDVNDGEFEDYTVIIGDINNVYAPVADFESNRTTVMVGETVTFTDLSTNDPTSWSWAFEGGTPAISTEQNPELSYNTVGNYSVQLTVMNEGGSDSTLIENYITVVPDLSYCEVGSVDYSKSWISQVQLNGYEKNTSGDGYSDFSSDIISLNESGNSFSLTPEFIASPQRVYFRIWIDWNEDGDFDDTDELVYSSPRVTETIDGSFSFPADFGGQTRMRIGMQRTKYMLPLACTDIIDGEFEDYTVSAIATAGPLADFNAETTTVSEGDSVAFSDMSVNNPTSWQWAFESGYPETSTLQHPVVLYSSPGVYSVQLTVNNNEGVDSISKTGYINVNEEGATYCEVTGTNFSKYWINTVEINDFSNTSVGHGFMDFTSDTITLEADTNIFFLLPGFSGDDFTMKWQVWIDWNADSDFEDAGELVANPGSSKSTVAGYFLSQSDFYGSTVMRVGSQRTKYGAPLACTDINGGEFEDYTVKRNFIIETNAFQNSSGNRNECISIYPNPAQDRITISSGVCPMKNVFIYSLSGNLVGHYELKQNFQSIEVSSLDPGLYIVKLVGVDFVVTDKFIKR